MPAVGEQDGALNERQGRHARRNPERSKVCRQPIGIELIRIRMAAVLHTLFVDYPQIEIAWRRLFVYQHPCHFLSIVRLNRTFITTLWTWQSSSTQFESL